MLEGLLSPLNGPLFFELLSVWENLNEPRETNEERGRVVEGWEFLDSPREYMITSEI